MGGPAHQLTNQLNASTTTTPPHADDMMNRQVEGLYKHYGDLCPLRELVRVFFSFNFFLKLV